MARQQLHRLVGLHFKARTGQKRQRHRRREPQDERLQSADIQAPAVRYGQKHEPQIRAEQAAEATKPSNNAENFVAKFSNALSALQSDPSNKSLYKVVTANDGEDLFKLLRRTYGAGTQNLPRFYVLSSLQSVNPGVMLEHLNAGDKVRVPRL